MPDWTQYVRPRLSGLHLSPTREAEIVEELSQHLDDRYRELIAVGMSPDEATRLALSDFREGNVLADYIAPLRQARPPAAITPGASGSNLLGGLWQDLRYAARMLRKNPGFAAVVVITLALGIGANTAIFSFVNGVILNPLPFPDSDRLVVISQTNNEGNEISVSLPNFQDWQARSRSFEDLGGVCFTTFNLTGVDTPQHLAGQAVTLNYFSILGVQPQLGRIFSPEEDKFGAARTALISDSLWRTTFGADPNILGRSIKLDSDTVTVIGVMPPGFELFTKPDILTPVSGALDPNSPWFDRGNHMGLFALGKLRKGISVPQAETEMRQIAAQLEKEYPAVNSGHGVLTRSLQASVVYEVRSTLLVLMGAVGFVLLIACVNVANLSLARSLVRQQEMGIRMALGAGRGRLIRQSLTESFLLSVLGGLAGMLVASLLLSALISLAPPNLPRLADVHLSGRVLLFTGAVTLLTSLLFGLLPALSSTPSTAAFSEGGRTSTAGPIRRRLFDSLLVAEIAFAMIVLTGAGLMARTMYKIANVDPGFRTDHLLTMRMDIYGPQYRNNLPNIAAFQKAALTNVKALPGVESAAFTLSLPIAGSKWGSVFTVGDQPVLDRSQIPIAAFNPVSPEYFQTMGIRLLRGRVFTEDDGAQSPKVAIINETMARHFWPNEDPIGKRVKQGWPEWNTPWREVIGVVADVKLNGVIDTTPLHIYLPLAQEGMASVYLAVRTKQQPEAVAAAVQSALHSLDSQIVIYQVRTMDERLKGAVVSQRAAMILLSAFAVLAMLLAVVGIYGVISWGVVQRTREMGLRMALGALPRDVMWLVLRRSMLLVLAGVTLGLLGAFALTRVLGASLTEGGAGKTPLLFGVKAMDPITFILTPILLALVAFLACCLPARRATKIDPLLALRYE
ncbi:MAG TPA: ABC transporter permease [Pyrinomonadaceae bacterium]|nr:ABC transporter permease [Pyrinomonadaceae bacterium]